MKRAEFLAWINQTKESIDCSCSRALQLVPQLDDFRARTIACWHCSLQYIRIFGVDRRLRIAEPIEMTKLHDFLLAEGLELVGSIDGHLVYMTNALAEDQELRHHFLETRMNSPSQFAQDFVIIAPKIDAMLPGLIITDEDLYNADPLLAGDIKAFIPHEILLSGRSARCLDVFVRKFESEGFRAYNIFSYSPARIPFPFDYYGIISQLRVNGLKVTTQMLNVIETMLGTVKVYPEELSSLDKFNAFNRSILYVLDFAAVAIRASKRLQDEYFENLIVNFLQASIESISWVSSVNSSMIPSAIISRWTVSLLDMLIPLVLLPEIGLRGRLKADQIHALSEALELIDLRKRKLASANERVLGTVEHISMFKWKRIQATLTGLIDENADKIECAPIGIKFLSPFEQFVSTPLEKALAPLHYQLVAKIYTGFSASLYQCIDLNSGNFVACKQFYTPRLRLPSRAPGDESSSSSSSDNSSNGTASSESVPLKEALKEAEILKLLQGLPYMVQFLGSAYESPYFFIFNEFYPGGTLSSNSILCGRDPMTPDSEVVWRARFRVLQQIKEGLAAIHELGIVHGDIKPANILFDEAGKVRIGDFGTAEYVRRVPGRSVPLCLENEAKGLENLSIPYMAPELLRGSQVTFASDIWAFGCLVLELASGCPPWHDLDATEILLKLDAGASPLAYAQSRLGSVPRHFLRMMSLSLGSDPKLRPSARDLLELHFADF